MKIFNAKVHEKQTNIWTFLNVDTRNYESLQLFIKDINNSIYDQLQYHTIQNLNYVDSKHLIDLLETPLSLDDGEKIIQFEWWKSLSLWQKSLKGQLKKI